MLAGDVIGRVRLLSSEEGGRKGPTPPDKLVCVFITAKSAFDCQLILGDVGALSPGQSADVPIKFLDPDVALEAIRIGTQFELWEGRVIGEGRVVQMCRC